MALAALGTFFNSESIMAPEPVSVRGADYFIPHQYPDQPRAFLEAVQNRLSLKTGRYDAEGIYLACSEVDANASRLSALAKREAALDPTEPGTFSIRRQIGFLVADAPPEPSTAMGSTVEFTMPPDFVTRFLKEISGENWIWSLRENEEGTPTVTYVTEHPLFRPEPMARALGDAFAAAGIDIARPHIEEGKAVITQDMLFDEQRTISAEPPLIGTARGRALEQLLFTTGLQAESEDVHDVANGFNFKLEAHGGREAIVAKLKPEMEDKFVSIHTIGKALEEIVHLRLGVPSKWEYQPGRDRFKSHFAVEDNGRVQTDPDELFTNEGPRAGTPYMDIIAQRRQEALSLLSEDFSHTGSGIFELTKTHLTMKEVEPAKVLKLAERVKQTGHRRALDASDLPLLHEMGFHREGQRKELRLCPEPWQLVPEEGYEDMHHPNTPFVARLRLNVGSHEVPAMDQFAKDMAFILKDSSAAHLKHDEQGPFIEVQRFNPLAVDYHLEEFRQLSYLMLLHHAYPTAKFMEQVTGKEWQSNLLSDPMRESEGIILYSPLHRLADPKEAAITLRQAFTELGNPLQPIVRHERPYFPSTQLNCDGIEALATKLGSYATLVENLQQRLEGKFTEREPGRQR
jgi:hypothetical protein